MMILLLLAQDVEILSPKFSVTRDKPQLSFRLKVGEGALLGVDILKVGVTTWTDDQGTNLGLKSAKEFYGEASMMTEGSGAELIGRIQGKHKPAAGAQTMSIEAEVPVRIGLELREAEAKDVVLKPGTAFDVGAYRFKVAKVERLKDSFDFKTQEILRVDFTFDSRTQLTGFDFLKELKFLGADGKEWKSKQKNFQGSFAGGGEHRLTVAFLPTDQALTVKSSAYSRIETVVVPLKHSGPIGK